MNIFQCGTGGYIPKQYAISIIPTAKHLLYSELHLGNRHWRFGIDLTLIRGGDNNKKEKLNMTTQ